MNNQAADESDEKATLGSENAAGFPRISIYTPLS